MGYPPPISFLIIPFLQSCHVLKVPASANGWPPCDILPIPDQPPCLLSLVRFVFKCLNFFEP